MPPRHPIKLYYLCPVENLSSILRHGIMSHNLVEERGLRVSDLSDPSVQEKRASNLSFQHFSSGKNLHEYVNLYINPNGPMMANILFKQQRLDQTVILAVDGTRALAQKGAIVSNGNCASSNTEFQWSAAITDQEWADISRACKSETSTDPLENRRKQAAEVLVPDILSTDYITAVCCGTEKICARVDELLASEELSRHVIHDPNLFFKYNRLGSGERLRVGMVGFYTGDCTSVNADVLVISTNTRGVMAAPEKALSGKGGLAGLYRLRCPKGYQIFRDACKNGLITICNPRMIDFYEETCVSNPQSLAGITDIPHRYHVFFPTKISPSYSEKSNPENIKAGLDRLGELLAKSTVKTITMPSLGCGLGGMDFIDEFAPMAISICNKYANKDGRKIYTYLFAPQELRSTEEAALEVQLRQIGAKLK